MDDMTAGLSSAAVQDPYIRAAFTRLERQGILQFRGIAAGPDRQLCYIFGYRCKCPGAPWRELVMPEWKVRAEFVC